MLVLLARERILVNIKSNVVKLEYNLYVSVLFINIMSPLYIGNYTVIE